MDGTVHREAAVTCEPVVSGPGCVGDEDSISCTTDADCTERPHGRCISKLIVGGGTSLSTCNCHYPCADDGDCEANEICLCAGVRSTETARCIPALCRSNADCPSGECSLSLYEDGCGPRPLLACRSSADTCRVESDCAQADSNCEAPAENPYDGAGAGVWQCEQRYCIR